MRLKPDYPEAQFNLLIGGLRADRILGGTDDLLIDVYTALDDGEIAIAEVLAHWAVPSDYQTRTTQLRATL